MDKYKGQAAIRKRYVPRICTYISRRLVKRKRIIRWNNVFQVVRQALEHRSRVLRKAELRDPLDATAGTTEGGRLTMKQWFSPKKDLREVCREKYGDDFADKYDMVNAGMPIGNFEETIEFLDKIEAVKKEVQE